MTFMRHWNKFLDEDNNALKHSSLVGLKVEPTALRQVIVISISEASIHFSVPFMESVPKSGTNALGSVYFSTSEHQLRQ
jgi:hypothetical protein